MAHAVLMIYVFLSNYGLKFEKYQGRPNGFDTLLYWIEPLPWMLYIFLFLTMLIRWVSNKKSTAYKLIYDEEPAHGSKAEAFIVRSNRVEKEINPYERASLFSRLLISWVYPKLKLGSTRPLQESDASVLRIEESSSYLAESLEPYLKNYLKNPNDNKALLKAVFHRFRAEIAWTSFLTIAETLMEFSGPVFILLIEAFINGNDPYWRGIALVIYFMIWKLIQAICISQRRFNRDLLGAHLKGAISTLIYSKSLKVSNLQNSENSPTFSYAQLVNLMQVDLERISSNIPTITEVFNWPIQMGVGIFLLCYTAGYIAATASIVLMVILFLINILLFKRMASFQKCVMDKKDVRMKYFNELLNAIKILKLYNWETKVGERVLETREVEMKFQAKYLYTLLLIIFLSWGTRNYLAIIIVGTMTAIGVTLSPGTVFASISVIGVLYWSIRRVPDILDNFLQMMISMKRIQDMAYAKPNSMIVMQDCSFAYTSPPPELLTTTEMVDRSVTLKNINLEINRGELVAVVGRVASGKSSLLQALINNMIMIKETDTSYMFVSGRVSYVSQESWIQNTTIKNNILFGSEFDENKYRQVIEASQLGPDLNILPGGDLTEIGEKGINLSGGQKARVSIARAAYADTDVVLLDDPLSAVDAHVGREIFNRCIKKYMSGKTIILVTNGQQFLPYVDRVVVMDNGQIIEHGTYQDLTENKSFFRENILVNLQVKLEEEISTQKAPKEIENTESKSYQKNVIESEDREIGRVSWNIYKTYIEYSGGWVKVFLACFLMILWMLDKMYSDILLSEWTDGSSKDQEENQTYYIVLYSITTFSINLFLLLRLLIIANSGIHAAKTIFTKQLQALLNAPINKFYDVTPSGRILSPIIQHFSETISGSETIRAYNYEEIFKKVSFI
jgi:ABC-type multidrug transport system fused ATPase/permease subunit